MPSFDRSYAGAQRLALDGRCWLDLAKGWVSGSDRLFTEVLASLPLNTALASHVREVAGAPSRST